MSWILAYSSGGEHFGGSVWEGFTVNNVCEEFTKVVHPYALFPLRADGNLSLTPNHRDCFWTGFP